MKYAIILGTRPEIIKLSPIIRFLENNKKDFFIIHTNQHYSQNMDEIFFNELKLPKAQYNLNVGSAIHGKQTGIMLQKIEETLLTENPDFVFVQGDTNTVLAGALAGSKLKTKIIHVEAGLRSNDKNMPEEINRIVTDHISDFLLCPTQNQKTILINEGINENQIFVTGNTISDAVEQNYKIALEESKIINNLKIKQDEFMLLTMHRPSNVDIKENILSIFESLSEIFKISNKKVIFPIHPRTKNNIEKFNINIPDFIQTIEPVGYLDMLMLIKNACIIFTDSGGIQEEACILNKKSITLRENTERAETIDVGSSILTGPNKEKIVSGYLKHINNNNNTKWENPFGINVTDKIFSIIEK